MARGFCAVCDEQELEIALDTSVDESYVSESFAQQFDNRDVELDEDGDYFLNFHFTIEDNQGKTVDFYKNLRFVDDNESDYSICLGTDFIDNEITLLTDNVMVIADHEAKFLQVPIFDQI